MSRREHIAGGLTILFCFLAIMVDTQNPNGFSLAALLSLGWFLAEVLTNDEF